MTGEAEKLDRDADVGRMAPEALWYDDAILHYRYHELKAEGQRYKGWTAEDMVNLHVRIVQELRRRGLPHFDRGDELDEESKPFLKEYADVRPSGNRMGEPVALDDVLPHLRTFKLRQPYVYLVGGLVVHGKTEGDVDILVKDSESLPPEFRHVLEWRILRSLPERLWDRVQFHYDRFHGPFTDNIPVFDLTVERANEENQVFRMDAGAGDLVKGMPRGEALSFMRWTHERDTDAKAEAPRAGTPEVARQAEDSRSEDRVELFRFFVPVKPVRGYFPEERQTLDRFLSLFGPEDFPVHSTKKYDGLNVEIHRSGDRVVVFSEDGEDDTDRLPGIVAAVRKLRWRDLVLLAEVEAWRGGKHLPREAVTGHVHAKGDPPAGGEPDDSELVANVYDVVYAAGGPKTEGLDEDAGDVHTLPFAKREKYLEALGIAQATMEAPDPKQRLNRAPSLVSRNLDELREHTERLARAPGSEGNVAKRAVKPYSLAGRSEAQVKYHNAAALAGIVIERVPTKVAGVFNYRYAILADDHDPHEDAAVEIDGKTCIEVGKTFSTARKATRGQIIEVEFETLNLVRRPDGTVSVTAWAPRVMGILDDRKGPDTVDEAVEAAKVGRVFQEKEITEEGETVYLAARPDDAHGAPGGIPNDGRVEKSNYLGSKRRLAKFIVDKFPEDAKTLFDPMTGVSGVLIEAARRGMRVRGNDLSIVPYWYSKGVFEGVPFSDADVEKLVGAPSHDGWLTVEWKGEYPRPRAVRRYLDGLTKLAREWKGPKGWTARGAVSAVVQTLYSESGSGYSTRRYESLEKVRAVVRRAAKEVSTLAAEVGGKGTITNEDAQSMRFPRADVVYFDPPYFKRDKGAVHYFQSYRVANSVLLGREWKEANLKPEDIPPVLERLCGSARHIFVSTSSNEVLPYAKELARHKRTMKRYRLSYRITSGFGSRDAEQHQNLFVAKAGDVEKQADPYMRLPDEEKTHRYVCQEHWRGRSMHVDLRIESVGNRDLIGWTLNTQIAGAVKEPVTTLKQAKALKSADHSKIDWDTGEFRKRRKAGAEALVDVEIVSERKAVEPHAWLGIEGVVGAGQVGATKQYPGVFCIVDKGVCEYGAQKPWVHEYFPRSEKPRGGLRYRILFRQLRVADIKRDPSAEPNGSSARAGEEEKALSPALLEEYLAHDPDVAREDWDAGYWEFLKAKGEVALPAAETKFREEAAWLLIKPALTPDGQTPYVLSDRALEDGWVPPKGFSALPRAARAKVPPDFRYWQMERESERREMRDSLVKAVDAGDVELPGVEKLAAPVEDEFEKRKLVPFNQWGGSAKYARRLVKRFPEHRRYVEPFCGAAAVLFVKDRADEEVLGDLDADVVFALKYIRDLTPAKFEELKRFNWTVSRAGFKRVRECEPKSDAERFWQFVYWRLCSWGGIPRSTGFSTLHAGQTYKLDDLWKFHERLAPGRGLKGVRIVRRDWKETLRECDGKGTLFFIDPPYIEEWGAGGKARGAAVPPEDIAEGVRSLKGSFVIAYTDSARARRALSKVGRIFKMRFLEARHHGLWSKRSRLFVASSDIRKALEGDPGGIEWLEAADGSARFVLQYHYFRKRGEKPVRAGPTTWHWDLRIDAGEKTLRHWSLDHDITKAKETVGYFKRDPDKRALQAEGFYPPGSFMNPTKDTPSFVEIVDKGECRLLVDQPALLKVEFEGNVLKGTWLLEKKNSNWHVRRVQSAPTAAPAAKAEEMLACSR